MGKPSFSRYRIQKSGTLGEINPHSEAGIKTRLFAYSGAQYYNGGDRREGRRKIACRKLKKATKINY